MNRFTRWMCVALSCLLPPLQPLLSEPITPLIKPDQANQIYANLIQNHWRPETGLLVSFADVGERKLSQQASTYEQAAFGLLAIYVGDLSRADRLFRFLRQAWKDTQLRDGARTGIYGLVNFYNGVFGGEGIEKVIHVGPNAWAALFAARLGNRAQRADATAWALEVAEWIRTKIPHDQGGVAMGPINGADGIPWTRVYSTENNISYYALLSELLKNKKLSAGERQTLEAERAGVLQWITTVGFDRDAHTMNRGFNPNGVDAIRALDTFTWLISSLGAQTLRQHDIDPDRIFAQIEKLFLVKHGKRLGMDATDQVEAERTAALTEKDSAGKPARDSKLANRQIWYEGVGQALIATEEMMDDARTRNRMDLVQSYRTLLEKLTADFDAAALPRSAGTAFAYATPGKLFHDGWWAPAEGPNGPAASMVSAIWRLFAGMGINPLTGESLSGLPVVAINWNKLPTPAPRAEPILFGTSDDMVIRGWQLFDQGKVDLAQAQAEATIEEWAPFADALQQKKQSEYGHAIPYTGRPEERDSIFSYWALNDVAAAYFLLGKIYAQRGDVPRAKLAFKQILTKYDLAQVWDPKGWFWSPSEAFKSEFVKREPEIYQDLLSPADLNSSIGKKPF